MFKNTEPISSTGPTETDRTMSNSRKWPKRGRQRSRLLLGAAMCATLAAPMLTTTGADGLVKPDGLVSRNSAGVIGDNISGSPTISADGRFVAFRSAATNLVSGDTNATTDIFVRDRQTGTTTIVSRHSDGSNASAFSFSPSISADGRFVAFGSHANNLVDDDTNGSPDVFVHDRSTSTTVRVSVRSNGDEGNSASWEPSISGDGTKVAFITSATNLVPNDTNASNDAVVHDLTSSTTTRVSVDSAGLESNGSSSQTRLSRDGSTVAFASSATNLVANDTNGAADIFVRRIDTGQTIRASVRSDGTQVTNSSIRPSLSGDGSIVAFQSTSSSLVDNDNNPNSDIFIRRLDDGVTELVSAPTPDSPVPNVPNLYPTINANGTAVVWVRLLGLLPNEPAAGLNHVYLRSLETGATQLMSRGANGPANGASFPFFSRPLAISGNGAVVAFPSGASNLVPGDTNATWDVFTSTAFRCGGKLASHVVGQFGAPTAGDDVILGTNGDDTINGLGGNDTICGAGGNDTITGALGNDVIFGGAGADEIIGGPGDDNLRGGPGNDKVFGREGNDKVRGNGDRDIVSGHSGDDLVDGGTGNDFANGGNGNDIVVGGKGNDVVRGHGGNDRLDGGAGFDRLEGGNGNDILLGRRGNDRLIGGNGNDAHHGGPQVDTCIPGAGADTKTSCEN